MRSLSCRLAQEVLAPADILFVVPPFGMHDRPAIGVHILQAIARRCGLEARVFYANLWFAACFGEPTFAGVARSQFGLCLGERLFARAAFDGPPLGRDGGANIAPRIAAVRKFVAGIAPPEEIAAHLRKLEGEVDPWLDETATRLVAGRYRVVGCTTSFEQTAASIAVLKAIKRRQSSIVTILGGANCEGQMAEGILSLTDAVDHVFSGESEASFSERVADLTRGRANIPRVVVGRPCMDLDALPTPDYDDYFTQRRLFLPSTTTQCYLTYETSRGCWWGQKKHCTFCGLNGQGMAFRQKTPARVLSDLKQLTSAAGVRHVTMVDNIMPHSFFKEVLPKLQTEAPGLKVMYEEKANLTLSQVIALTTAGIDEIQPGIEALSTGLLRQMDKGSTASQNLALLRYAQITGLKVHWNLLFGFPGDELDWYTETIQLLPSIVHLPPPKSFCRVIIDRFSPYYDASERYGISEMRPLTFYNEVFPITGDIRKLAYHFEGTFRSAAYENPDVIAELGNRVSEWRERHALESPVLTIQPASSGNFILRDTRRLPGRPRVTMIDESQAVAALVQRRISASPDPAYEWAVAEQVAVRRDGRYTPLATAPAQVLLEMEERVRHGSAMLRVIDEETLPALA